MPKQTAPKSASLATAEAGSPESAIRALGTGLALRRRDSRKHLWELVDQDTLIAAFGVVYRWTRTLSDAKVAGAVYWLRGVVFLLEVFLSDQGFGPSSRDYQARLPFWNLYFGKNHFLEPGRPAPDGFMGHVCLELFRRQFRNTSVLVCTMADVSVSAFRYTPDYSDFMELIYWISLSLPVRRRLACDGEFLAGVIKLVARAVSVWEQEKVGDQCFYIFKVLTFVRYCVAEKPRPFLDAFIRNPELQQAFEQVRKYFTSNWEESCGPAPIRALAPYIESELFLGLVTGFVAEMLPNAPITTKLFLELRKVTRPLAFMDIDSCDYCMKPETESCRLKKCGRCLVSRYCSVECQRAAWISGNHKLNCRERKTVSS